MMGESINCGTVCQHVSNWLRDGALMKIYAATDAPQMRRRQFVSAGRVRLVDAEELRTKVRKETQHDVQMEDNEAGSV